MAYFNPRSPCGERLIVFEIDYPPTKFQPTLPVRGATPATVQEVPPLVISTHAPRAGSDRTAPAPAEQRRISTHAPRAGSDLTAFMLQWRAGHFNPRSPCGERLRQEWILKAPEKFQPTLPVRGATWHGAGGVQTIPYFNPRSPCGERREPCIRGKSRRNFNPRSPCGERRPVKERNIRSL